MSQQATLTLQDSLLLHLRAVLQLILLSRPGTLDSLLNPLEEVDDLVVDKVLVDLHFFLEVSHLAFVDKLEDPRACVFDGLNVRLLQVEHLLPYLGLELPV